MKQRQSPVSLQIAYVIEDRLGLPARIHEAFFPQFGQVLRQGGLAQSHSGDDLTDRKLLRLGKVAKNQQPHLVGKGAEELARLARVLLQ